MLPQNFARGSYPVFVVFRQISVKQKPDRAHSIPCFWVRTIRVKTGTAAHSRKFPKHLFKTHTEALQTMLDFIFYNEIAPKERFGPTGWSLENLIKKGSAQWRPK
ncbi:BfmA/BtgA family mobilization protein [uncultured Kriegella sp.]|uniref:BfmA/BtgA family mobilization protein n=1 Tax=uncultured Kriegella sp. TaxID=1798910 RepID=UPI0030DA0EF9